MSKAEKARDFVDFVYNSRYAFSLSAIDGFYKVSIVFTVLIALVAFVGVDRFGFTFEILFPVAAIVAGSEASLVISEIFSNDAVVEASR